MLEFIPSMLTAVRAFFRTGDDTALEVFALRQQVAVLKRKRPPPRVNCFDRLFRTTLRHGELLMPGFEVPGRTVARYLRGIRRRGDPSKPWLTFLQNHREVIVAFDFFTVPNVTFKLLGRMESPSDGSGAAERVCWSL